MAGRIRIIVWAQPPQRSFIEDALKETGVDVVGAGGSDVDAGRKLAALLQCPWVEDLRHVGGDSCDAIWIADPQTTWPLPTRPGGLVVLASIMPGEVSSDWSETTLPIFCPRMRLSPGCLAAAQVLEQFGQRRCVNVFFRSADVQSTLAARLLDAMDLLDWLCGTAEMIDAALAFPGPGFAAVPETLVELRGHLTCNLRYSENRCACIAASDQAGAWFRGVTVLGDGGCLRIDDSGFEWIAPDGRIIDSSRQSSHLSPGALVARHLKRIHEGAASQDPPPDFPRLLALCEATRVSCRTGQGEAPGRMLELLSRP